jgi:hypothetical protein
MEDKIPEINIPDTDLNNAGYTISGKERRVKTVNFYPCISQINIFIIAHGLNRGLW